jgi:uncharacterized protein
VTALAVTAVIALGSFVQAVSGFGFALVAVPLVAMLTDPLTAVVTVTMVSCVYSAVVAVHERSRVDWGVLWPVTGPALVGMPLGLLITRAVPTAYVNMAIGVMVVGCALMLDRMAPRLGRRGVALAGVTSGALLTSTGTNGPPVVIAVSGRRLGQQEFRATLQATFVVQDVCAVLGFIVVGSVSWATALLVAGALPALPVGWWAAQRVLPHVDERVFSRVVKVLLVVVGVVAVASAAT